jgi:hypothetical protein
MVAWFLPLRTTDIQGCSVWGRPRDWRMVVSRAAACYWSVVPNSCKACWSTSRTADCMAPPLVSTRQGRVLLTPAFVYRLAAVCVAAAMRCVCL